VRVGHADGIYKIDKVSYGRHIVFIRAFHHEGAVRRHEPGPRREFHVLGLLDRMKLRPLHERQDEDAWIKLPQHLNREIESMLLDDVQYPVKPIRPELIPFPGIHIDKKLALGAGRVPHQHASVLQPDPVDEEDELILPEARNEFPWGSELEYCIKAGGPGKAREIRRKR